MSESIAKLKIPGPAAGGTRADAILDRSDVLVDDLSICLPAESAARCQ